MFQGLSVEQMRRLERIQAIEASMNQRLREAYENGDRLRFNQLCVNASSIAEQYFCERKVEIEHLYGRVETETKRQGSEWHESLLTESVEVDRDEILGKIFSGEPIIVHELPLLAEYRGVILAGQPDAVLFNGGAPMVLFEYKFSNSTYPYRSYHAQARVYGRILDGAGFDTSNLFYAIAVAPMESRDKEGLFKKVIDAVNESGPNEASLEVDGVHVYVYEYNQPAAERDIDWALDYWRGSRDMASVDNPAKCRGCEYKEKCQIAS